MRFNLFAISALFMVIFSACNENSVDTKGISEELQKRKIVRITESEIFDMANKTGEEVIQNINESAKKQFDSLTKTGNYPKALQVCSFKAFRDMDSLANIVNAFKIVKADTAFNSSAPISGIEKQLLDAYRYNLENKLELKPNLQAVNDTLFVYMSPIQASTACTELSDKARLKLNSFQGIWCVYMKKRDLVLDIQNQPKKK